MPNAQRQTIETVAALAGSATFDGAWHDMESAGAGALGYSVHVTRDTVDTDVDVILQVSHDKTLIREKMLDNLPVTSGNPDQQLDVEAEQATRRYMRVRLVNKTVNALSATDLITIRKENP
ncbi:MAG: hypothetical protein LN413_00050 [Candidatus Thermoplasmatota archaeon]|nr:hypothetical protein [Candidatus Thermoplasmatota archaeon]